MTCDFIQHISYCLYTVRNEAEDELKALQVKLEFPHLSERARDDLTKSISSAQRFLERLAREFDEIDWHC